ncbi:hypothetical protein W822_20060 [Advenella kashmirensis W13003]|uniref:Uncharacterized protein n=1 Tax=Advenella kashmirensis W13003 TaxID=1424334 RepID=V8QNP3_9BURK|nr:hypothetical protein [Advenella kashmirensis]ETF00940.1 hypothetical protein W822_20060 [Advenella kashmirensis W13003]
MIDSNDPIERIEAKLDLILAMLLDDEDTEVQLPEDFSLDASPFGTDRDIPML